MGDDTPAANLAYDSDTVSTADTQQSGVSIIDELWCALQPPIFCELLTFLQPATISALAACSSDFSDHLQLALLWFVLQLVSSFFSVVRGHV